MTTGDYLTLFLSLLGTVGSTAIAAYAVMHDKDLKRRKKNIYYLLILFVFLVSCTSIVISKLEELDDKASLNNNFGKLEHRYDSVSFKFDSLRSSNYDSLHHVAVVTRELTRVQNQLTEALSKNVLALKGGDEVPYLDIVLTTYNRNIANPPDYKITGVEYLTHVAMWLKMRKYNAREVRYTVVAIGSKSFLNPTRKSDELHTITPGPGKYFCDLRLPINETFIIIIGIECENGTYNTTLRFTPSMEITKDDDYFKYVAKVTEFSTNGAPVKHKIKSVNGVQHLRP